MAIRTYLIVSRILLLGLLSGAGVLGWLGYNSIQYQLKRSEYANRQLVTLACLSSAINSTNMHIGRMFIINAPQTDELIAVQKQVRKFINDLQSVTLMEFDWVKNTPDRAAEEKSKTRIEHLLDLSNRAATTFDEIIKKFKTEQATVKELYTGKIVSELEPRIKQIIKTAVSDEESKILEIRLKIQELLILYGISISSLLLLSGTIIFISGPFIYFSFVPQLKKMISTTLAVSEHRPSDKIELKSNAHEMSALINNCNTLISEMHRQQTKMNNTTTDLEEQISTHTLELTSANERLQRLDKMRIQFLADISHELKTPLTAMKGETEIILRKTGHDEKEYRAALTRVKVLTDQMNSLVDDLMFLARSETDTVHFEFKKTDLEGLLASAVSGYEILGRDKNINFKINWAQEAIEISLDMSRIKQMFGIIIDNAIKYSNPDTDITISVSANKYDVIITFTNTGKTISPDDLPYIFERFYRGKDTAGQNGFGLGLAIARWIVEKHRGSINITSTKKGITDTTVILPRTHQNEFY